jgi:hypothetical protein
VFVVRSIEMWEEDVRKEMVELATTVVCILEALKLDHQTQQEGQTLVSLLSIPQEREVEWASHLVRNFFGGAAIFHGCCWTEQAPEEAVHGVDEDCDDC